ncbi:uncharacterized protein BJX67DRAFT_379427 [Aspergillus lucknowensis]|uniref:Uncharacterized protein n=1 Tax=Aspergillus lucknowensis TaxID=176173 RepID=A0ABR4M037_9EURO
MTSYVLTGAFTPEWNLTEETSRQICTDFATFLRGRGYRAYEVWAGFRPANKTWRFLVALLGPVAEMPDPTVLNDVQDLFNAYVVPETSQARWVEKFCDPYCWDVPGWVEWGISEGYAGGMECLTMLSCDRCLGEVY